MTVDKEMKDKIKDKIRLLIEKSRVDEANSLISQYEKAVMEDVEIYALKGVIAMLVGKIDDAEKIFSAGLEEDPLNLDIMYNLAYLHEIKGAYLSAYKLYIKLLQYGEKSSAAEINDKLRELEALEEIKKYLLTHKKDVKVEALINTMKINMAALRAYL